jgi:hypothetical protein
MTSPTLPAAKVSLISLRGLPEDLHGLVVRLFLWKIDREFQVFLKGEIPYCLDNIIFNSLIKGPFRIRRRIEGVIDLADSLE